MTWLNRTNLLFLIILIEGYVVLSSELLALRLLVPFVGSGVEVTSIVISAVLLPLAFGYYVGGTSFSKNFIKSKLDNRRIRAIRHILLRNVLGSLIVLSVGFSYILIEEFFSFISSIGLGHRLSSTTAYVLVFLVGPMYWLGQTVPLTSHYFAKHKLSSITGRIFFFSTIGSFLGSLVSTLVLMSFVGVHNTVIFTLGLLCFLAIIMAVRERLQVCLICSVVMAVLVGVNSNGVFKYLNIVSNNAYNMVQVYDVDDGNERWLLVNRSTSSRLVKNPESSPSYTRYIEKEVVRSLEKKKEGPLDILVLGAAGFDFGRYDQTNNYTFIDIDPDMKDIAEQHFIEGKLSENKTFIASSARAYVTQNKKKYDLIFVDVYSHYQSIPMETTTVEFYRSIKSHLTLNGVMASNIVMNAALDDRFSVRMHNTLLQVFPTVTRQLIEAYNFNKKEVMSGWLFNLRNIIYIYVNTPFADDKTFYTDDLNTSSLDKY